MHARPSLRSSFLALCVAPAAAAAASQGVFVERAAEVGLVHEVATGFDRVGGSNVRDFAQRGLAVGDIDGDGDPDVVACGGVLPSRVLLNAGGAFVPAPPELDFEVGAFDTAPALADFDRDGDLDLVVGVLDAGGYGGGGAPRGRFYRNDGGTLVETTTLAGTVGAGHTIFLQWADLDRDGLLDVYTSEFYATPNRFYRNNGDGTFTERGAAVGLDVGGSTHVTCVLDADGDARPDVLVGNDYDVTKVAGLPENLGDVHARGQADGTWADVTSGSGFGIEEGIMGLALGDVNYDGRLDVYKTDAKENWLMINHGWPTGGAWVDEAAFYGVLGHPIAATQPDRGIGWGAAFVDFDRDRWLDLLLVNGQVGGQNPSVLFSPRNQRNFLWTGNGPGGAFTFADSTEALGIYDEVDDRCLAVGDLDSDGDVDVIVAPTVGFLRYFENRIDPPDRGWLLVRPECGTSAPGGHGVVARFTDSQGYPHVRQIGLDGSTASQHEPFAYFGLGAEPSVDLEVEFPSGLTLAFPGTPPNQELRPVEPELIRLSARTQPIAPATAPRGTRSAPSEVAPDELFSVSVFAHDAAGTMLDGAASVAIEVPGLPPLSDVLHLGGNAFRRYYRAPAKPGAHRATVTIDGWEVGIRPRVHFFDPADASGTRADVVPAAVRAGSADTFTLTVAPRDAAGVSLGPGRDVEASVPGHAPLGPLADLGDGRYAVELSAPAVPGAYPIEVRLDGAALGLGLAIEAAGAPSAVESSIAIESPEPNISAAPHQMRVLLTPRDALGLRLGPRADVQLVAVPDAGSTPAVVRDDLHPEGQRDGDFPFVIEKPQTEPPAAVSGVLQIWLEGVLAASFPYAF